MKGNKVLFIVWLKTLISCLSAQTCAYFMEIVTIYLPFKGISQKVVCFCRLLKYFEASLTNSEHPDQTAPVGSV